jgi:hypothetical protein
VLALLFALAVHSSTPEAQLQYSLKFRSEVTYSRTIIKGLPCSSCIIFAAIANQRQSLVAPRGSDPSLGPRTIRHVEFFNILLVSNKLPNIPSAREVLRGKAPVQTYASPSSQLRTALPQLDRNFPEDKMFKQVRFKRESGVLSLVLRVYLSFDCDFVCFQQLGGDVIFSGRWSFDQPPQARLRDAPKRCAPRQLIATQLLQSLFASR